MSTSIGSKKQTNVLVFRAAGGREERVRRAGSQVWHYHGHDDHDDGGDIYIMMQCLSVCHEK